MKDHNGKSHNPQSAPISYLSCRQQSNVVNALPVIDRVRSCALRCIVRPVISSTLLTALGNPAEVIAQGTTVSNKYF